LVAISVEPKYLAQRYAAQPGTGAVSARSPIHRYLAVPSDLNN
jgi:hypothetical protein